MDKFQYKKEIIKAMKMLGKHPDTIFLGQNVEYKGGKIFGSLVNVPMKKRLELPIMEDSQMGMSIGLSLMGFIPVSIYPRFDFLICAMNQLINHLDKIKEVSDGEFKPKVIIRTQIGSKSPKYPGLQHCSDYTEGLKLMLKNVNIVKLTKAKQIVPSYKKALENSKSTLLIEMGELYIENKSKW